MAKIKQIGNKKELSAWIKKHFSDLPNEAKKGLETLTRAMWSSRRRNSPGHAETIREKQPL